MDTATVAQCLLQTLWPQICAHCREDLTDERLGPLCLNCRRGLTPQEPPFCLRCADKTSLGRELCLRCAATPRKEFLARAAFLYKDAAISLIHAFKFRGRRSAARAAGTWMGFAMDRHPELGRPDALIPMPLHPQRRRERGYNQALLLAEGLSSVVSVPVEELLIRTRATKPLWALGRRQRIETLKGAFALSAMKEHVMGRRFLLIDDVCTSGSSLEACAEVLRAAGAQWARGYALARQTGAVI